MATYVEITDLKNGVAYEVNPGQVETLRAKVSAGITTTLVDLANGDVLETSVALATLQEALEDASGGGGGGGSGTATELATTGDAVVVNTSAPPSAGQTLVATSATEAEWGTPAGGGDLLSTANLSDLDDAPTARTNLGLGTAAEEDVEYFELAGAAASEVSDHVADTDPHGDRSFATSAISTHAAAVDPHGDRSFATSAINTAIADKVVGPASVTDSRIVQFDGTTGKLVKANTLTGILKATSGVPAAATAGVDYSAPVVLWNMSGLTDLGTPAADASATATVAYSTALSGSAAVHKAAYVFSVTTGVAGKTTMWPLNGSTGITMPATKRFTVRFTLGPRNAGGTNYGANLTPYFSFAYQDITHFLFPFRDGSTPTNLPLSTRNNSTTSTSAVTGWAIGLNDDSGGTVEMHVQYIDAVAGVSDPIVYWTAQTWVSGNVNTSQNTMAGLITPDASWRTGGDLKLAVGVAETGTGSGSTYIANVQLLKHPLDR